MRRIRALTFQSWWSRMDLQGKEEQKSVEKLRLESEVTGRVAIQLRLYHSLTHSLVSSFLLEFDPTQSRIEQPTNSNVMPKGHDI